MSDRVSGFFVTLKQSMSEEEAEQVKKALQLIRGVIDVRPTSDGATLGGIALSIRTEAKWRDAVFNLAMNGPKIEGD